MFNILKIFKKKPSTIPYKVETAQNDVNDMKDELPLVNEGLLSQPLTIEVISADEKSGVKIGDRYEFNSVSLKTSLIGASVDKWLEERGIVKLVREGYVIKAKVV